VKITIGLEDGDDYFGVITTEEDNYKKIKEHLKNYKNEDELYTLEGFLDYLEDKGIVFEFSNRDMDYSLYF